MARRPITGDDLKGRGMDLTAGVRYAKFRQCEACAHFIGVPDGGGLPTCTAFPGGVPGPVWANRIDHRFPVPGDDGVTFEDADDEKPFDFDLHLYSDAPPLRVVKGAPASAAAWKGDEAG